MNHVQTIERVMIVSFATPAGDLKSGVQLRSFYTGLFGLYTPLQSVQKRTCFLLMFQILSAKSSCSKNDLTWYEEGHMMGTHDGTW